MSIEIWFELREKIRAIRDDEDAAESIAELMMDTYDDLSEGDRVRLNAMLHAEKAA